MGCDMNIRFQFDVTVTIAGMDELIAAIRGDLSAEDKAALQETAARIGRHVRKLERLDRETPAAE